jgi:hypothetical protein
MEPISPELALVDPELARIGRQQLHESASEERRPTPPVRIPESRVVAAPPKLQSEHVSTRGLRVAEMPAASPPRRFRGVLSVLALILAGGGAVLVVVWSATRSSRPASSLQAPASRDVATFASSTKASGSRHLRQHQKSHSAPPVPAQTHVFAWVPVRGSTSYLIRFYRGRRIVLQRSSNQSRFTLPGRWLFRGKTHRLAPGRYRWEVLPVFGRGRRTRLGHVTVESTWTYSRGSH